MFVHKEITSWINDSYPSCVPIYIYLFNLIPVKETDSLDPTDKLIQEGEHLLIQKMY